jgi:hypothetical protein
MTSVLTPACGWYNHPQALFSLIHFAEFPWASDTLFFSDWC